MRIKLLALVALLVYLTGVYLHCRRSKQYPENANVYHVGTSECIRHTMYYCIRIPAGRRRYCSVCVVIKNNV